MDSLRLGVEVWVFARLGLHRLEPADGGALGSGPVRHLDGEVLRRDQPTASSTRGGMRNTAHLARLDALGKCHMQSRAHPGDPLVKVVLLYHNRCELSQYSLQKPP